MTQTLRTAAKRALFGAALFSRFRPVALSDPQAEVSVWLHGLGAPRDVTATNLIASANPLTIGLGMKEPYDEALLRRARPLLYFCECRAGGQLLGKITLSPVGVVPAGTLQLCLFTTTGCANLCVPRVWLWSRYAYYAWKRRGAKAAGHLAETSTTSAEERCLMVFYICPRPVMLASVSDGKAFNLVPLDLMGTVGAEHLAFSVHTTSAIVPLIERSGRIALSSVPAAQTAEAYGLGRNHNRPGIDLAQVHFPLVASKAFGLQVPQFALRVREFDIESARTLGSYTLFIARRVEDEHRQDGPQFFLVHGFYKRLAGDSTG